MANKADPNIGPPDGLKDTGPQSQTVREIITAVLSLAIAAISLWMLVDTYLSGRQVGPANEAYGRQKDLLLYSLALLGTVTGYYLGRVPAELHAVKADREAKRAQAEEARTKRKVRTAIRAMKAKAAAEQAGTGVRHASPGGAPETSVLADLDALLEDLEE